MMMMIMMIESKMSRRPNFGNDRNHSWKLESILDGDDGDDGDENGVDGDENGVDGDENGVDGDENGVDGDGDI